MLRLAATLATTDLVVVTTSASLAQTGPLRSLANFGFPVIN